MGFLPPRDMRRTMLFADAVSVDRPPCIHKKEPHPHLLEDAKVVVPHLI